MKGSSVSRRAGRRNEENIAATPQVGQGEFEQARQEKQASRGREQSGALLAE
jgi:hypothetical protein